jgi:polar amino acid transport system substrate-binding protein
VWDIAFLAVEPVRAAEIDFTAPYVLIEGTYMVPKDSALKRIEDVDKAGIRIAVATGSAYDLYLTRTIKNATLVRAPTGPDALNMFVREKLEAAGGVKQPLVEFAASNPGVQVLDGRFMAIQQAMGMPKGRSKAHAYLQAFIEEMKASGFCAQALKRSNQPDAVVAPPA